MQFRWRGCFVSTEWSVLGHAPKNGFTEWLEIAPFPRAATTEWSLLGERISPPAVRYPSLKSTPASPLVVSSPAVRYVGVKTEPCVDSRGRR